jgi:hypothetical protein
METLKRLDELLRGDLRLHELGPEGIRFPFVRIIAISILLAAIFGVCIATFTAVSSPDSQDGLMQLLASAVKAPLLFYLTLLITFPSLYVFSALMGSRLNIRAAFGLLVAAIAVMITILASLGPIIVFFAFSTPAGHQGYRFILLLVVALSTGAGILGLTYLLRMLWRFASGEAARQLPVSGPVADDRDAALVSVVPEVSIVDEDSVRAVSPNFGQASRGTPGDHSLSGAGTGSSASSIFRVWVVVFAIIGAQMSWVLRPFIGTPGQPFTWFRQREGNFFQTVSELVVQILTGN